MRSWLFLAVVSLWACSPDSSRPDVIVIVMDTTRADHTSLAGHPGDPSPFLRRLAPESTVYTDAWGPTCWTGPSHATLFTGLRPESHGFLGGIRLYLDESAETLAEVLSRAGYGTACLTCNPTVAPEFGLAQGFDTYERFDDPPGAGKNAARRATEAALQFLRQGRSRSRPSFLFLNHWQPHLPYDPPPEMAERFLPADATPAEIRWGRAFAPNNVDMYREEFRRFTPRQWAILTALYLGEVATLDAELEFFITSLREEGDLDNTLLVITSDHGENLGEHRLAGHIFSLHRAVRRIPLLVRFPAGAGAGRREDSVVRLEDVYPTILEQCGEPLPLRLDGLSLMRPEPGRISRGILGGTLRPERAREHPEFARSGRWRPQRAVYDGRYHLIRRQDGHEELYDLDADPAGTRNLATEDAATLDRLRSLLPVDPW